MIEGKRRFCDFFLIDKKGRVLDHPAFLSMSKPTDRFHLPPDSSKARQFIPQKHEAEASRKGAIFDKSIKPYPGFFCPPSLIAFSTPDVSCPTLKSLVGTSRALDR